MSSYKNLCTECDVCEQTDLCSHCNLCNDCLSHYCRHESSIPTFHGFRMNQVYLKYNTCANCLHDFPSIIPDEEFEFICKSCSICRYCSINWCSVEHYESYIKPALFLKKVHVVHG